MFPAAVHYREFAPCEALREHVRAFFSFAPPLERPPGGRPLLREVRLREGDPLCPRSVADGHVSLVFSFERAFACGGHWRRSLSAPRGDVIGPLSAAGAASLEQQPEAVGVFLRAGRARAFLGATPAELADRSVALDELWGAMSGEALLNPEPGEIEPDAVHLPGIYVQRVLPLTPEQAGDKHIERRTVAPKNAAAVGGSK